MGVKQSKRSVDISTEATKADKVAAGEPLENGTITTASADEKQVIEANGGVEETTKQNGSTPHIDEKETTETEDVKEPVKTEEEKTEVAVPISEANGDVDTVADESSKTPTDETTTEEVQASAEKKIKKKKSWILRSLSLKKDKSKPVVKKQAAADVKTETVEEVAEVEIVKEEVTKPETESAVEVPEVTEEEPAAVVNEKEPEAVELNITNVAEIPPPLPSSPPPVEAAPVAPTPTIVETPAPVQPVEPEVVQAEPEDEAVGGGEGLAEPPEGLNTSDIEKEVAEVPLVNGNHVESEQSEPSSPDLNSLSEKIEAIKLSSYTADINETTNEISNDLHEVNGVCDAIAVTTNGDAGHEENN